MSTTEISKACYFVCKDADLVAFSETAIEVNACPVSAWGLTRITKETKVLVVRRDTEIQTAIATITRTLLKVVSWVSVGGQHFGSNGRCNFSLHCQCWRCGSCSSFVQVQNLSSFESPLSARGLWWYCPFGECSTVYGSYELHKG